MATSSFNYYQVLTVLLVSFWTAQAFPNQSGRCTETDLNEAQRAFRNCVESAKASMVGNYAQENNGNNVCSDLDNMLGGCDDQVNKLSHCTSRQHVENLKAIHLSSITDVLQAINTKINVERCSVYTEKTVNPVTTANNEYRLYRQPEAEPVAGAASLTYTVTVLAASIFLSLHLL